MYSDNDTISVIFQNNNLLVGVVGEFNSNLKELEKITETNIYSRGNSILIKSTQKKNELVKNAIKFLAEQFINNGSIEKKDIISSINKFMIDEKINNTNKKIEYIIKTPKTSVIPRSEKQKEYVRALKDSDIIVVCITYNKKNFNFVDSKFFNKLKKGSIFVNTSRGEVVDENALIKALSTKKLVYAATDVVRNEQNLTKKKNKLIEYSKNNHNLLITPHMAGLTYDSERKAAEITVDNIKRYFNEK